MGLDNIILPIQTLQKLYPSGIVNAEKKITPIVNISFKGDNRKHVLVLTDTQGDLKQSEKELLKKLIESCKLTPEDIALVNLADQPVAVSDIIAQLKIKKAIFFGVPFAAIKLPIEDSDDKLLTANNCTIVKTVPLSTLQYDVNRKRSLWHALKILFEL
ncbi:MAG: hypothetical protein KIT66_12320 [Chitinophagaceae bacterium]|nr:hypothetical protein [Chitinophagaceae bacterium]